jgi:hypothetical protein
VGIAEIPKPGLAAAEMGLAIIGSFVEADIANDYYKEQAGNLNALLKIFCKSGEVDAAGWADIQNKISEVNAMQLSWAGWAWEKITYGQGSLAERKGWAFASLANELGAKYGYQFTRTWSEWWNDVPNQWKKIQ